MTHTLANSLRAGCTAILIFAPFAPPTACGQSANDGFDPNVNGTIHAIALQADGRILAGGAFFNASGFIRSNIARFLPDGVIDTLFFPDANGSVQCLAVQPDASILIGGNFATLRGQPRNHIGRLSASGSLDTAFDPNANGTVKCVVVQSDRRILVGGEFTALGGQPCNYLARLQTNGSVDLSFSAAANSAVRALVVQRDGKVLGGGAFTTLNGHPRECIGRLMADGSLDQVFCPAANGPVNSIVVQVDGKTVLGGEFTMLNGQPRGRIGRLNADGSLDTTFDPPADGPVNALALQADGKILVGGSFTNMQGQARTNFCRLHPDGSLDDSFILPANGAVHSVAVQSDGKIVFGGAFTAVDGTTRNRIARAYRDGSLDATLAGGTTGLTTAFGVPQLPGLAIQPDGKILIGGNFSGVDGQQRKGIARLNAGGRVDTTFVPSTGTNALGFSVLEDGRIVVLGEFTNRSGLSTRIGRLSTEGRMDTSFDAPAVTAFAMAAQPDGKTLVGGQFSIIDGHTHLNIARFNLDGSLDEAFVPSTDALVYCLAVQPDGRILIGGYFLTVNGELRSRIARLNEDGSLDFSFNPGAGGNTGTFSPPAVQTLVVQPDGKILVGGRFTTLAGQPRVCLGRLNADGRIDSTFANPRAYYEVHSIALRTDGKIVVGGEFTQLGGLPRLRIARLNPDGTPDTMFNPGADYYVHGLAIQDDGKILLGGWFTNVAGQLRPRLARVTSGSAARQLLEIDAAGTTVTWSRSGASPEVGFVTYEISDNGIDYELIALPTRIAGGWQQTGLTLPVGQNFFVRARGRTSGGRLNSSRGMVESVAQFYLSPPTLTGPTMESNGTFRFAFSNSFATAFTVLASTNASLPVTQWEVLGAPLPMGGGLYEFTDSAAANRPQRFYQLRTP